MIASLNGILLDKTPNNIILECNGVGYEVKIPLTTFSKLPEIGSHVFIFTYLKIYEDRQIIYGFANACEKKLFEEIIKLNKIGPKIAIAILGVYSYSEVITLINNKDAKALAAVPGIGKTTAERMIIELNSKINSLIESINRGKQQMQNISSSFKKLLQLPTSSLANIQSRSIVTKTNNFANTISKNLDLNKHSINTDNLESNDAINTTTIPTNTYAIKDNHDSEYLATEPNNIETNNLTIANNSNNLGILENFDEQEYTLDNYPLVSQEKHDAILALAELGMKPAEAEKIINQVYQADMTVTNLIKASLNFYKGKNAKTR